MFRFLGICFGTLVRLFCSRQGLLLENLALRQQVSVLKRRHPRPKLDVLDRLFWLLVRRFWSEWKQALLVVTPETVVRWHRAGFRWYWALISKVRKPIGRTQISKAIKRFAGDDFSMAKYYDFDSDYLIEKEAGVRHYEVYTQTSPAP